MRNALVWPGILPPKLEFGSSFYNPKQTPGGKEALDNFLRTFSEFLKFTPDDNEIAARTEEVVTGFDPAVYFSTDEADYRDLSSFEDLVNASTSRSILEGLRSTLGENLDNWNASESGALDSQVLMYLLGVYNGASFEVSEEAINRISENIEGLSNAGLEEWCERLEIEIEENDEGERNYAQARTRLQGRAQEMLTSLSSSFPQFNTEALEGISLSLEKEAMTPPIALIGVNIVGSKVFSQYNEMQKNIERRAKELEQEFKKLQAERKAEGREMLSNKLAERQVQAKNQIKNQRRGKV